MQEMKSVGIGSFDALTARNLVSPHYCMCFEFGFEIEAVATNTRKQAAHSSQKWQKSWDNCK